jgi:primosomal protein N' (replication factor Y)
VPYGNKIIDAVVLSLETETDIEDKTKLKNIHTIKYEYSFLYPYQILLLSFVSHHYFCLLHTALSVFLPKNVRQKIVKETLKFPEYSATYSYNNKSKLNTAQQDVYESILKSEDMKMLLYGVTGSGKTNIYIELIQQKVSEGEQVLLLVPEIILSSQIAERISKVFGNDVLVLNSSVSEAKKTDIWMKIHSGEFKIVIGTRSALFYPYKNLGMIIIDEEHDNSYKSETAPRYDAREIAFKISDILGIPVLL